jgi:DNA-directed RNA polymerase specialized sigma24 family protein
MQLPLLIKQLKHDDGEAFRQLFLIYSPRIYNYCRKFFSAREDAEEIVQIVFTAVWENRLQIDENRPFSAYIFTGELPPRRREIFVLSRQNGLSYKEIARKLSVTESTVNTQITKSIDYIHRKLQTLY